MANMLEQRVENLRAGLASPDVNARMDALDEVCKTLEVVQKLRLSLNLYGWYASCEADILSTTGNTKWRQADIMELMDSCNPEDAHLDIEEKFEVVVPMILDAFRPLLKMGAEDESVWLRRYAAIHADLLEDDIIINLAQDDLKVQKHLLRNQALRHYVALATGDRSWAYACNDVQRFCELLIENLKARHS